MSIDEKSYGAFSQRVWQRDATLPIKAHFEITYRCNLHCVHCYTDPFNRAEGWRRELPLESILGLFDQLAACGVLWLSLSGGEAMAHPRFREIYRGARERGFIVSLLSNATLLTDSLIEFLKSDPPFQLDVSMHGASAGVFDRVTQVSGSYERYRAGIEKIRQAGLPLRLKTNALTLNQAELPAIKAFVESLGLKFSLDAAVHPRLNGDVSSTAYRLPARDVLELEYGLLADASPVCEPSSETSVAAGPPLDDRLFRCGCGTTSVTINPYGMMRACTFTTWPTYDLKTLPVRDAFAQLSSEIRNARYQGESRCRTCPAYSYCDKNPVAARAEVGSMEAPVTHFCDVAFGRMEREEALV